MARTISVLTGLDITENVYGLFRTILRLRFQSTDKDVASLLELFGAEAAG